VQIWDFPELHHDQIKVLGFQAGQALRARGEGADFEAFLPQGRRIRFQIFGTIANDKDLPPASNLDSLCDAVVYGVGLHERPLNSGVNVGGIYPLSPPFVAAGWRLSRQQRRGDESQ
jgi:hypothetical protein